MYGRNVISTSVLEVSLLRVGTVLRLERDAWSMVKRLRQATNEYAPRRKRWPGKPSFGHVVSQWVCVVIPFVRDVYLHLLSYVGSQAEVILEEGRHRSFFIN